MITLQLWRSVCPDITDEEWPLLIDVFEPGAWTPAGARAALAAFRRGHTEGKVEAYDRVEEERRADGVQDSKRGWRDCSCRSRMLLIACRDCGEDRTVELLSRWGYRLAEQGPRLDGRRAAEALDRAWRGAKRDN